MAAKNPSLGIRHHTIVPANFEPDLDRAGEDRDRSDDRE